MRGHGSAIGGEFHRHLWALAAYAVFLLSLGPIIPAVFGADATIQLVPPDGLGALLVVPLSFAFFYYLAVFSYGLSGDLAGRASIFPRRLFTLPVTTLAIAAWPMLYGVSVMLVMWSIFVSVARVRWGANLPLLWPGLLAAVILAWTQALTWMPYGLPGMRIVMATMLLVALDTVIIVAAYLQASEAVMVALLAPQLPLAYWVATIAVARARRGDVPDWQPAMARRSSGSRALPPFRSPAAALRWFEWRQYGWSLPAMVLLVVPFELGLLWVPVVVTPRFLFGVILGVLITPPVMAGFVAITIRKDTTTANVLPMSTVQLVHAKLTTAAASTVVAWLLVLTLLAAALAWSRTWELMVDRLQVFSSYVGASRAVVAALLIVTGLVASTWKRLVQSLYSGLSGYIWITRLTSFSTLLAVMSIGPLLEWISESGRARLFLWDHWRTMLAVLVTIKMTAAAWIIHRLSLTRLVSDRTLVGSAAAWTTQVVTLYVVLVWFGDSQFLPAHVFAMIAMLSVPLARLGAAPLALAWNRHR